MRSPVIRMALHILIAYLAGLFGGNLLLDGLTDGLSMTLLPVAFFASLPLVVVAVMVLSPLYRSVDRYFLPLAILVVAGTGTATYVWLGPPSADTSSAYRTTAVVLSLLCATIACLTLFVLRRAFAAPGKPLPPS